MSSKKECCVPFQKAQEKAITWVVLNASLPRVPPYHPPSSHSPHPFCLATLPSSLHIDTAIQLYLSLNDYPRAIIRV